MPVVTLSFETSSQIFELRFISNKLFRICTLIIEDINSNSRVAYLQLAQESVIFVVLQQKTGMGIWHVECRFVFWLVQSSLVQDK